MVFLWEVFRPFGGKVKDDEPIRAAAIREVEEEAGLRVPDDALEQAADIVFSFADAPMFHCHAFRATAWEGVPRESDEMRPQWFRIDDLPYESMWESDQYWLPQALSGEMVKAVCRFDPAGEKVEKFEFV